MTQSVEIIPGLPYLVTDSGKVWSIKYKRFLNGHIDKYGYRVYDLWQNGHRSSFKGHRLVGQAFIPNPQNKPTINHLNLNKMDNEMGNLEWATHSEQQKHYWRWKRSVNFSKCKG